MLEPQREVTLTVVCGNCGNTATCTVKTGMSGGFCAVCCNCCANVVGSYECKENGQVRTWFVKTMGGQKR